LRIGKLDATSIIYTYQSTQQTKSTFLSGQINNAWGLVKWSNYLLVEGDAVFLVV
jgi:hypothetical protein